MELVFLLFVLCLFLFVRVLFILFSGVCVHVSVFVCVFVIVLFGPVRFVHVIVLCAS